MQTIHKQLYTTLTSINKTRQKCTQFYKAKLLQTKHYKKQLYKTLQLYTTTQHFETFHKTQTLRQFTEKNTELFFYKTLQQLYNTSQSSQQLHKTKTYTTLQHIPQLYKTLDNILYNTSQHSTTLYNIVHSVVFKQTCFPFFLNENFTKLFTTSQKTLQNLVKLYKN